ncbi:MAG TPA: TonB-dependent receptor [Caulobacteraceae bacterium]
MGASVVALAAFAAPAMAQTAAPAAPAPAEPATQGIGGADVIVTAEHRQTRLQKVPVAVSVFTGASRDRTGIQSVQDVTNFAPGFTYDTVTVNAGMRGVTRQNFNVTDDSRVAAYEDEFFVYSPYNLSLSSLFFSQEQIERGPQNVGGRNSEGGSIDMIAVRPTDTPYAELRSTIGNFNSYEVEGAASDQVAPGLTARVAGNWNYQGDGYYKNAAGGPSEYHKINEWHVEGSADWKPSSNFDAYVRGELGMWNTDEGDAGTRQFLFKGSWDEVNLVDGHDGAATGSLGFEPNYGYAALVPGAAAGAAAVAAAQAGAGLIPQELPIAATLKQPGIFNNPSQTSNSRFATIFPRTAELQNFDGLSAILTYHFPDADLKYIGGVQGYDYTLNLSDTESDVLNYTLPGSAFGEQAGVVAGLGAALGIPAVAFTGLPTPSTLTINPNVHTLFIENNWWHSHELSLQSTTSSPFQYVIGGIYYYQQYSQNDTVTENQPNLAHPLSVAALGQAVPFLPSVINNPAFLAAPNPGDLITAPRYQMQTRSIAGYVQVSYKFTDSLKLTGNLRYSYDEKWGNEEDRTIAFGGSVLGAGNSLATDLYNILIPLYGAATPSFDLTPLAASIGTKAPGVKAPAIVRANGFATRSLSATDNEVTGGVGLDWSPNPDTFMYARYSRGYAPLAFSSGSISAAPEVGPEFINSYEIGYKHNIGRQLSVDIAAFYYDYDQIQLPITESVNGILTGAFINFPKAESTGIEVEGVWNPTRDLLFTVSYSYDYTALLTKCNLTTNVGCLVNTDDPLATGPGAHQVAGAAAGVQSVNGAPLPNAPRNKIAATGAYTWHLDPGNLTFAATYIWRDAQLGNTVFNTPYNTAPSWSDVDLRATWSGDHDRYEVIAYVKNLLDSLQYPTGPTGAGLYGNAVRATSEQAGLIYNSIFSYNPPRTFGVELRYKFF